MCRPGFRRDDGAMRGAPIRRPKSVAPNPSPRIRRPESVAPAEAGAHGRHRDVPWIPAFAGMTGFRRDDGLSPG